MASKEEINKTITDAFKYYRPMLYKDDKQLTKKDTKEATYTLLRFCQDFSFCLWEDEYMRRLHIGTILGKQLNYKAK